MVQTLSVLLYCPLSGSSKTGQNHGDQGWTVWTMFPEPQQTTGTPACDLFNIKMSLCMVVLAIYCLTEGSYKVFAFNPAAKFIPLNRNLRLNGEAWIRGKGIVFCFCFRDACPQVQTISLALKTGNTWNKMSLILIFSSILHKYCLFCLL